MNDPKWLTEMEEKARTATQGEWIDRIRHEGPFGPMLETYHSCGPFHKENPRQDHHVKAYADAAHIAANSPERILALLKLVRKLGDLNILMTKEFFSTMEAADIFYSIVEAYQRGPMVGEGEKG